jgi:hypothetical protein
MALELVDGKFYRDGVPEPLEFGNKEQIKLMNQAKETLESLMGDGLVVEPDFEITVTGVIRFKCPCGQHVYFETDGEDELQCDFEGLESKCRKCQREYEVVMNDDDDWTVKLKS